MPTTVHTTERIAALRRLMQDDSVDVYVVGSADEHGSEYIASCDERRAFISGFDGSAGTALITPSSAFLFTDGRYFLQAAAQLDANWELMRVGVKDVPTWQEWIEKHSQKQENLRVGIDPRLISASDAESLTKNNTKVELVTIRTNLVDVVWGNQRPARPSNVVWQLPEDVAGEGHVSKLKRVRDALDGKGLVLSALDEIAWLFNLRGTDIDYNPVFFSYAIIDAQEAVLFLQGAEQLTLEGVRIEPYSSFWTYLEDWAKKGPVLLPPSTSLAVSSIVPPLPTPAARSIVGDLKAIKNSTECAGFRASHVRDGAALVKYFAWLEEKLASSSPINEYDAALQLESYRAALPHFKGLSFPTISSTGPNAAIIHYSPPTTDSSVIEKEHIYLCDSGAQYIDGTTDVTRTFYFGSSPVQEEVKRAFTRVLQGHIAIDTAVFPEGTTGFVIDSWARRALWSDGLDYRHGTGHGVGHYLNVHEGPHGIGTRIAFNGTPLKEGMTVSNEPGYYKENAYGIRIENVVLVVPKIPKDKAFGDKPFFGFERLTMCPIGRALIDVGLLESSEIRWVDEYHREVKEKVRPLLEGDERAVSWLERECAPLGA
ncbi:Creatinase/aminopeptidase [Mucidula mucida]|nr:Creatinase/aminopeptidase [Mucidula mucida]